MHWIRANTGTVHKPALQAFVQVVVECSPLCHSERLAIQDWHACRHIVEFKGVGCMEPQTPEAMTTSLYIVQEFMSGSTLKVTVTLSHDTPKTIL